MLGVCKDCFGQRRCFFASDRFFALNLRKQTSFPYCSFIVHLFIHSTKGIKQSAENLDIVPPFPCYRKVGRAADARFTNGHSYYKG